MCRKTLTADGQPMSNTDGYIPALVFRSVILSSAFILKSIPDRILAAKKDRTACPSLLLNN
jgi:hypothetical protein